MVLSAFWRSSRPLTGASEDCDTFLLHPLRTIAIERRSLVDAGARYRVRAPVAGVAELVDAVDLGSTAARHGGSSPFARTSALRPTA